MKGGLIPAAGPLSHFAHLMHVRCLYDFQPTCFSPALPKQKLNSELFSNLLDQVVTRVGQKQKALRAQLLW